MTPSTVQYNGFRVGAVVATKEISFIGEMTGVISRLT